MKKRIFALLLCCLLLFPTTARASELWRDDQGDYVTIRVPYPEGQELPWASSRYLSLRYADTGELIPLASDYLQGYLFATVPTRNAARPIEVFQGNRFDWTDIRWQNEPMGANVLQIRGILQGNEKGELRLNDTLTRAEAFAMLVRLLSLESDEDPGYADVAEGSWCYDTVCAARSAGLAAADTHFRPNDPVTRGELTVMVYRAFSHLGWADPVEGESDALNYLADAGKLPGWAREAYLALGSAQESLVLRTFYQSSTLDSEGAPVEIPFADAHKDATREEAIGLIYDAMRFLPVYPSETAVQWGFDEEMPVIDGSTSTYPYTQALYGSLFQNYPQHPDFPISHSKSHASYERLIKGEADVLFAATKASLELEEQAKAAGVDLEYIPIAYDAMVFFSNSENSIEGVTLSQLQDIYVRNAYTSWDQLGGPEAKLLPYCRNVTSGSHALMEQMILNGGAWALHPDIIKGNVSLAMSSALTDVAGALQTDPPAYAIGFSVYYYYLNASYMMGDVTDNGLKLLAVDGVHPTDETIADGTYPLAGRNYIVLRSDEPANSPARRLAEFMRSEKGQQVVVNAGFGSLKN